MLNLFTGPTDDRAKPAFKNVSSCKKWLQQLQFTNLPATQALMRAQLDEFDLYEVRGLERLQVLETLRETVHHLQEDCAKKLSGKPLPLSDTELVTLTSITGLWRAMFIGYFRCLMAFAEGDKQLKPHAALLCHRCLTYCGRQIFEFLRAGYEFDNEQWRQFHSVYLFAEENSLLTTQVEDKFSDHGNSTSSSFIYLSFLFTCHARVQELTFRQQALLVTWFAQWSDVLSIERTCVISRGDAPPLAIDTSSPHGLQSLRQEFVGNSNVRFLPMVPMSKLLRVKTILLQQGQSPSQLGLGGELDNATCIKLLTHLHKQWCEHRPQRQAERLGSVQEVQLRYGLDDVYAWVARRPSNHMGSAPIAAQEAWRVEDISILGARLQRKGKSNVRIGINQFVAVQAADAYQMASTVWVTVMRTGELHMGIRFLPGTAKPAMAKIVAKPGEQTVRPVAVLLLSAVSNLNIPATLLIPRNLYQPERLLELTLAGNESVRCRIKFSVELGLDFARVSFVSE
jgi:hypothetical protein